MSVVSHERFIFHPVAALVRGNAREGRPSIDSDTKRFVRDST